MQQNYLRPLQASGYYGNGLGDQGQGYRADRFQVNKMRSSGINRGPSPMSPLTVQYCGPTQSYQNHLQASRELKNPSPTAAGSPRSIAELLSEDTPKFRQLPCRTFISVGTCPYRERCVYLHDPRCMSKDAKTKTRKKNKEDIVIDSLFWPVMSPADVSKRLDSSRQPHVIQAYHVPRPQWDQFRKHDQAVYSMWMHFVAYCYTLQILAQEASSGIPARSSLADMMPFLPSSGMDGQSLLDWMVQTRCVADIPFNPFAESERLEVFQEVSRGLPCPKLSASRRSIVDPVIENLRAEIASRSAPYDLPMLPMSSALAVRPDYRPYLSDGFSGMSEHNGAHPRDDMYLDPFASERGSQRVSASDMGSDGYGFFVETNYHNNNGETQSQSMDDFSPYPGYQYQQSPATRAQHRHRSQVRGSSRLSSPVDFSFSDGSFPVASPTSRFSTYQDVSAPSSPRGFASISTAGFPSAGPSLSSSVSSDRSSVVRSSDMEWNNQPTPLLTSWNHKPASVSGSGSVSNAGGYRSYSLDDDLFSPQLSPVTVSDISRAVKSPSERQVLKDGRVLDTFETKKNNKAVSMPMEGSSAALQRAFPFPDPPHQSSDRFFTPSSLTSSAESLESCFIGLCDRPLVGDSLESLTDFDNGDNDDNDDLRSLSLSLSVLKPIPLRSPHVSPEKYTAVVPLSAPPGLLPPRQSASPFLPDDACAGTKRLDISSRTPFRPSPSSSLLLACESSEFDAAAH